MGACAQYVVSEPDPRKIEKEGLVNWLGWKCTLRQVCRRTPDWLLISILMCVYWKCQLHESHLHVLLHFRKL